VRVSLKKAEPHRIKAKLGMIKLGMIKLNTINQE
jgi:hypothetical protein